MFKCTKCNEIVMRYDVEKCPFCGYKFTTEEKEKNIKEKNEWEEERHNKRVEQYVRNRQL